MRWSLVVTVPLGSGLVLPGPASLAVLIAGLVVFAFCLSRYLDHVERVKAIEKAPADQIPALMSAITGHGGSAAEVPPEPDASGSS